MKNPHVLLIPFPAQGHVLPLMEVALHLVKYGFKITFVNSEFIHERVIKSMPETDNVRKLIKMVSLPDGLESSDDRSDTGKLWASIVRVMPGELKVLIERINGSESDKISCIIAETSLGWAIEVAEKMGIKKVAFWPAASALFALLFKIPSLIDEGIIDSEGTPMKNQIIQLSQAMPPMKTTDFFWNRLGDEAEQKLFFKLLDLFWQVIGLENQLAASGNKTQQPRNSVIYVAFGSFTVFDKNQFKELALSLELTKRPFLWVVRENTTEDVDNAYPIGFRERVQNWGRMVAWAPQQNVLSHPSIACFISHCGWNSTIEGISSGVPFLCWPYFSDQMFNQSYICDCLKIGLKLNKDHGGIIRHEEINNKLEQLLGNERFKELALDLQSNVLNSVREGGSSYNNFKDLVAWIKD
ncbi:UDP-glycosyltransferase 83A1-like [Olea europaea subsp. europaea]|uniref:UDP-glycosyltransferase 83A1-like n=1 Tax=Olea europaea subsp. europaea TaxID=158383 RepID=A0A8S0UFL3_OLEEU|nr:UDP-glycosyltransferase 83A1-like [Olea europaea subsp. europaea]